MPSWPPAPIRSKQNPLFTYTLFPVYFGVLIRASLLLRNPRLAAIFPLVKPE